MPNDFITVAETMDPMPEGVDLEADLETFLDEYDIPTKVDEVEWHTYDTGRTTITVCSEVSPLPGGWFMMFLSKKYGLTLDCQEFSITDDELLNEYKISPPAEKPNDLPVPPPLPITPIEIAALDSLIDNGKVLTYDAVLEQLGMDYTPKNELTYLDAIKVIRYWNKKEHHSTLDKP